eukprot:3768150-Amphidinium_carterae.1
MPQQTSRSSRKPFLLVSARADQLLMSALPFQSMPAKLKLYVPLWHTPPCLGLATLPCNSSEYDKVKQHLIVYELPWDVYSMGCSEESPTVEAEDSVSQVGEALKRKALEDNGRAHKVARLPSRGVFNCWLVASCGGTHLWGAEPCAL